MIREVVGRYLPLPKETLPVPGPKLKFGGVRLVSYASLESPLAFWRQHEHMKAVRFSNPKIFEELGHACGYVLYTTKASFQSYSPAVFLVSGIKNRGYVFTKQSRAVLSTDRSVYNVSIVVQPGEDIKVLVENTGRINYGLSNHDPTGITQPAYPDGRALTYWTMEPLPLNNAKAMKRLAAFLATSKAEKPGSAPGTFYGRFTLSKSPDIQTSSSKGRASDFDGDGDGGDDDHYGLSSRSSRGRGGRRDTAATNSSDSSGSRLEAVLTSRVKRAVADSFLDMTGWGKGVVFINGFNLGRYWPSIGPQVTLYLPGVLLRPHPRKNEILTFESESAPTGNQTVNFVEKPILDGPVPGQ